MQLFPCPFCGLRPENEFHYGTEARTRPEPAAGDAPQSVPAAAWAAYLYTHRSPKGESREIWRHDACQQWFVLRRNTATHTVLGSESLGEAAPTGVSP